MRTASHTHLDNNQGELVSEIAYLDKESYPRCITLKIFEEEDRMSNLCLFFPRESLEGLMASLNQAYDKFIEKEANND